MVFSNITVLITSHNRRETTIAALHALSSQRLSFDVKLRVILVDAGSTDGTREAVRDVFPDVQLIEAGSDIYWNRGMHIAFLEARAFEPDAYLWLNDDTILCEDALERLMSSADALSSRSGRGLILVGATCDPVTGERTYGGLAHSSRFRPYMFKPAPQATVPREVDTMNGNCVLVSADAVHVVGNLDPKFTHAIGDVDYGLRARKLGCMIWTVPGFIGTCPRHVRTSGTIPIRQRWIQMLGPKGLPPGEWGTFLRRHGGPIWLCFWALPYVRLAAASVMGPFTK